jgi:hypothetical protein
MAAAVFAEVSSGTEAAVQKQRYTPGVAQRVCPAPLPALLQERPA